MGGRKDIDFFLWYLVLVFLILFGLTLCSGCVSKEKIKIYKFKHENGRSLFIRDLMDKDVLAPEQASGYLCISPEDFKKLGRRAIRMKNKREN